MKSSNILLDVDFIFEMLVGHINVVIQEILGHSENDMIHIKCMNKYSIAHLFATSQIYSYFEISITIE